MDEDEKILREFLNEYTMKHGWSGYKISFTRDIKDSECFVMKGYMKGD
jgi:hypothetical protein